MVFAIVGIFATLYTTFPEHLSARTVQVFELKKSEEEARQDLEKFLDKIDRGNYSREEETMGFSSRITSSWSSPFEYNFYFGRVSSKVPDLIFRMEMGDGDGDAFRTMLIEDGYLPEAYAVPGEMANMEIPGYKYHLPAQGLNLIAPWLGVLYTGAGPRMTSDQKWTRFFTYLVADLLVVGVGGTNGFRERFNISKNGDKVLAGLVILRMIGAYQAYNTVRGHNRMVRLEYRFPIE